jgi:hypothetical protein
VHTTNPNAVTSVHVSGRTAHITVTAQDGTTTKGYRLTVRHPATKR